MAIEDPIEAAMLHVSSKVEGDALPANLSVTLNFHPDAICRGMLMLEALAADGVYRSQFETLTSNGGLTAYPGGGGSVGCGKTLFLAGRMSMPAQACARNMGRLITGTESLAAHRALVHHIFECAEACWSEPHSVTRIAFLNRHTLALRKSAS